MGLLRSTFDWIFPRNPILAMLGSSLMAIFLVPLLLFAGIVVLLALGYQAVGEYEYQLWSSEEPPLSFRVTVSDDSGVKLYVDGIRPTGEPFQQSSIIHSTLELPTETSEVALIHDGDYFLILHQGSVIGGYHVSQESIFGREQRPQFPYEVWNGQGSRVPVVSVGNFWMMVAKGVMVLIIAVCIYVMVMITYTFREEFAEALGSYVKKS